MRTNMLTRLLTRAGRDEKGGIATMAAIMMLPLILTIGVSIDFARLAKCQVELQDAADAAALSGAAAYGDTTQAANAVKVATNYFNTYIFAKDVTVPASGLVVTSAVGTAPSGVAGYQVSVSASGTVNSTLMALASFKSFSLSAKAIAMNPIVKPQFTFKTQQKSTPASDWNSVYAYGVPMDASGNPQYTTLDSNLSKYYELSSSCNSIDTNYSPLSRCVGQYGATIPNNQVFPTISATQPIAFMFVNMTAGLMNPTFMEGNSYGSPPGDFNLLSSAYLAAGLPPSQYTNNRMFDYSGVATHYPTATSKATPNCAVIIQVVDPNNLPTSPPTSGSCFADDSAQSGYQYGALSCAAMAGRTFMYWWNDMGGSNDDVNYFDAFYTVTCTTGNNVVVNTNGSLTTATSGISVILVQ